MGKIIKPNVTYADILKFLDPIITEEKEDYEEKYKKAKIKNVAAIILSFIFAGVITYIISMLYRITVYEKYFATIIGFVIFLCTLLYCTYIKPDRIHQVFEEIKNDFQLMVYSKADIRDSHIIDLLNAKYFDEECDAFFNIIKDVFPYTQTVIYLKDSSDSSLYEIKEDNIWLQSHDNWDFDVEHTLTISEKIDGREYRDFRITTFNREDYSCAINLDFRYIDKRFEKMRKKWEESH